MGFSEIAGHESQKEFLRNSVRKDRVAHAYLFSGPKGIGKKLVAKGFAQLINCADNRMQTGECTCVSCVKIEKGLNPDVLVFDYPDEKTIKVDHIRDDIEHLVYLTPYENPYKVFIVDDAQRMNFNAQNAFLKTLEEPPQNSVIILLTTLTDLLMPTIRSRCQVISFQPLETKIVREILEKKKPQTSDPELIARMSGGSVAKALDMEETYIHKRNEYINCLMSVCGEKPLTLFNSVEKLRNEIKQGGAEELNIVFDVFSSWLRDSIVLNISGNQDKIVNIDLLDRLSRYSEQRNVQELIGKFAALEQTMTRIARNNANVEISLENLLLRLSK